MERVLLLRAEKRREGKGQGSLRLGTAFFSGVL